MTTQEQITQEIEKKIKEAKRLENICMGASIFGLGSVITGINLDNEMVGAALVTAGYLVGASSAIFGYYTILGRRVLENYLKDHTTNSISETEQGVLIN